MADHDRVTYGANAQFVKVSRPPPPMNSELEDTAHWDQKEVQAASKGAQRRAWLTVLTGTEAGRVYPLSPGVMTIGREAGADVVLADKQVSRRHTQVELRPDGSAVAWDCSSRNGTMLGRQALGSAPRVLRDGAKLQIGGALVLRFSFRDDMEEHFERKLYDSATRDGLTGAFNKRYFTDRMRQEFQHAERYGRAVSLVLFDLDNFKKINDTHGHDAGDEVLRRTVDTISRSLRDEEVFARYGGEEFVSLLRKSDLAVALMAAERMRRLICKLELDWLGEKIPVSASFGVASTAHRQGMTPERLFREADQSLYRAKRAGKNRVCGTNATGRR
jgi:two-component system cell cycle response regulator